MRIETIVVLLIVISCVKTSELCSLKNPFLKRLESEGQLRLFSVPMEEKSDNKCAYEWKIHKTCCNYIDLITYIENDKGQIKAAENNQMKSMKIFLSALKSLVDSFSRIKFDLNSQNLAKDIEISLRKTSNELGSLVESKDFISASNECWNKMASLRLNRCVQLARVTAAHISLMKKL